MNPNSDSIIGGDDLEKYLHQACGTCHRSHWQIPGRRVFSICVCIDSRRDLQTNLMGKLHLVLVRRALVIVTQDGIQLTQDGIQL